MLTRPVIIHDYRLLKALCRLVYQGRDLLIERVTLLAALSGGHHRLVDPWVSNTKNLDLSLICWLWCVPSIAAQAGGARLPR